jgi:hypothetical protein
MKSSSRGSSGLQQPSSGSGGGRPWYVWLVAVAGLAVVLLALRPRSSGPIVGGGGGEVGGVSGAGGQAPEGAARDRVGGGLRRSRVGQDADKPAEVVVADRVSGFAGSRREIARELARRANLELLPDVDRFFDAVQSGNWAEVKGLYNSLSSIRHSPGTAKTLEAIWPSVAETFEAAAVAKTWPAEELLAYGESVATSLRPGTIYLSGTEAGRAIPGVLGDRGGTGTMILGPDSFSDPAQLEYLALAYPDRFGAINREEIDRILKRDQAPVDGRSAPGLDPKSARAAILKALIERNPGLTFAVDGSFDLGELAMDIVPSGPVLEIRPGAGGGGGAMPPARASDTADYWRATAQRLETEAALEPDAPTRREYAQMALIQAKVLEDQKLYPEAEKTYRAAVRMAPASYDPVERLVSSLIAQGKAAEATEAMDEFARVNPGQAGLMADLRKRAAAAGGQR